MAYAPNTGKVYSPPYAPTADSVLVVDPDTNTTSFIPITLPLPFGAYWGIAFADNVQKLVASPYNTVAALLIDPVHRTTDATTLAVTVTSARKWRNIAYASNTQKL